MNLDRIIAVRNNKTLYRDGDRCLKVFCDGYSKADVLNEALNQSRMEEAGLNVPKILEVTSIDGKWTIVSEYISGKTLSQLIKAEPEKTEDYMSLFIELQKELSLKTCPGLSMLKDKMKYCIIWEAANGAHPENSNAFRSYFVPFWIENYFKDSRYMVIDNKPVLLVFGINHFINDMGSNAACKTELDYLREEVKKLGFDDLIILASNAWDSQTLLDAGLDGCYAYNWGTKGYDVDYSIGRIKSCADVGKTYTVPTLSTGFNSLPWHGKRYPNMSLSDYERGLMWIRDTYFETYPKKTWRF